jgi:hypothetical protein
MKSHLLWSVGFVALLSGGCQRTLPVVDADNAPGTVRMSASKGGAAGAGSKPNAATGAAASVAPSSIPSKSEQPKSSWMLIDGPKLGSGTAAASVLRKPIAVELIDSPDYMVVRAFLLRAQKDVGYGTFVIELKNVGAKAWCFIDGDAVASKDASGAVIEKGIRLTDALMGSLGIMAGTLVGSCLSPSERGYIVQGGVDFGPGGALFERLASFSMKVGNYNYSPTPTDARLSATGYTFANGMLAITVANVGTGPLALRGRTLGALVLLDSDNLPIAAETLELDATTPVAPGATTVARTKLTFEGTSQRVQLAVDPY